MLATLDMQIAVWSGHSRLGEVSLQSTQGIRRSAEARACPLWLAVSLKCETLISTADRASTNTQLPPFCCRLCEKLMLPSPFVYLSPATVCIAATRSANGYSQRRLTYRKGPGSPRGTFSSVNPLSQREHRPVIEARRNDAQLLQHCSSSSARRTLHLALLLQHSGGPERLQCRSTGWTTSPSRRRTRAHWPRQVDGANPPGLRNLEPPC